MISIIVPVYKAEKFLSRCVDSILAQTFADFELLLVDDGSPDNSGKICDEYASLDPRVRVFHKPNGGVSSARNLGVDNARGEWIAFVDADDWTDRCMYELLVNEAKKSNADIVVSGFTRVLPTSKRIVTIPDLSKGKIEFIRDYMLYGWTVVWNLLISRNLLVKNDLRFNIDINVGEDFVYLFKAFVLADNIHVYNEPLYFYDGTNEESALHNLKFEHYKQITEAHLETIAFFKEKGIFHNFEKEFAWKILRAKQDLVLRPEYHDDFLKLYPESHKYILSCPTIGIKIKIMMWLLCHKLGLVTTLINYMRRLKVVYK